MLCKLCGNVFLSQDEFVAHCKDSHLNEDGLIKIPCPDCDRQYHLPNSFRWHLKSHGQSSIQSSQSLPKTSSLFYFVPINEEIIVPQEEQIIAEEVPDEEEYQADDTNETEVLEEKLIDDEENHLLQTADDCPKSLNSHMEEFERKMFLQLVDLLADDSLPRNKAVKTVRDLHGLYCETLRGLYDHLNTKKIGDSESNSLLELMLDPAVVKTEYRVIKELKKLNFYVEQKSPILDSNYNAIKKRPFVHAMKLFNLTDLFNKLFKLPNFFNEILGYIKKLDYDSEWISNVIQSPYWKNLKSSLNLKSDEIALPLYVYNDDFEPLNVLGSHRGAYKLSGVYLHMPCLPPDVQSKLQYIFPAMLFFSSDRSSYGNSRVFTPLIDELNKLQNGIKIEHEIYKVVKIIPVALLGDNLGLNSMMGFVQCFVANYYCRICRSHKNEMGTADVDDTTKRRTRENYEIDCKTNNHSLTGIIENKGSVWNTMKHFHVVTNLCVDIMHDLFEGACHFILCEILYAFIYKEKYFTLDVFNQRLKKFDFGSLDKNTNIALVTTQMIARRKLNTSAAEMLVLFTNFGFMVGDLVPEDAPEWSVYSLLRQIISLVLQKTVHRDTHHLLKDLISEHHIKFQKVFQKKLTPKLHFMVHYPHIMELLGPICHVSSMRFESFHCIFKHIIKNINCRKDILESCFFKIRMRFASMFLKFNSMISNDVFTGKKKKVLAVHLLKKFNCQVELSQSVYTTKFVESKGVKLRIGNVIQIKNDEDETPVFALIKEIIISDEKVLIGYQQLSNTGFDERFNAYKVELENIFFIESVNFNVIPKHIFEGKSNIKLVISD